MAVRDVGCGLRRLRREVMKVVVDRERCMGTGNCVACAPAVFSQDDGDNFVVLLQEHPVKAEEERVREAADLCPARAILIEES
jgi:ferredoxin